MPENNPNMEETTISEEVDSAEVIAEEQAPAEATAESAENSKEKESFFKKKKDEKSEKELKALQAEIEKLKADLNSEKDAKLRVMAEYDNFRKRSQREKSEIYPDAVAGTVLSFLPAFDSFERALACETADAEFKKGFEMIFGQLKDALAKLKIEETGAMGEPFDPNLHNAVMHIEDENLGENAICEIFQKGYKLGDKIVRCAMVKVAN